MIEELTWILAGASLLGTVLNIKRYRICFAIWLGTNFSWMVYDFHIRAYAQSFLFAIYVLLAVWGLYEWRKESK